MIGGLRILLFRVHCKDSKTVGTDESVVVLTLELESIKEGRVTFERGTTRCASRVLSWALLLYEYWSTTVRCIALHECLTHTP